MAEDHEFPRAVIARLIKEALPEGINVAKDAKLAIGVAARVFVSYITAIANESALETGRKTLSAQDILSAVEESEFAEFLPALKDLLGKYKAGQQEKKKRKSEAKAASAMDQKGEGDGEGEAGDVGEEEDNKMQEDKEEEEGEEAEEGEGEEAEEAGQSKDGDAMDEKDD